MMMPGIDGWEVLRRIDVAEAPPIIVITALSTDRDRHVAEVLELGALEVVSKPFDPGWLVRLANAVLLVEPDERATYRRRRLEAARPRRAPNGPSGLQRAPAGDAQGGRGGPRAH